MDILNVLLCGVGGQGILTCGRVMALAALEAGLDVKMSEVHGMAQRGGNVDTHVRIGPCVHSALIPRGGAHVLVAFEKLEALRYLDHLRSDGVAYVCPTEIHPLSLSLKRGEGYLADLDDVLQARAPRLVWVDAPRVAAQLGEARMLNLIVLGAVSGRLPLQPAHWEAAIRERFPERLHGACLEAFQKGVELVAHVPRAA